MLFLSGSFSDYRLDIVGIFGWLSIFSCFDYENLPNINQPTSLLCALQCTPAFHPLTSQDKPPQFYKVLGPSGIFSAFVFSNIFMVDKKTKGRTSPIEVTQID